ncbi:MAG: [protein-PII] uridylyltransferase [Gammaproteobacteria bacterium]
MTTPSPLRTTPPLIDTSVLATLDRDSPASTTREMFRGLVGELGARLARHFATHRDAGFVVGHRAATVADLLARSWALFGLDDTPHALVAVGGFGRGELHPQSDVDIAIPLAEAVDDVFRERLERWLTFLWDIGLEVGHSVRTPDESARQAAQDLTVATNLMESRLLAGSAAPYAEMLRLTGPDAIWPVAAFFRAKLAEQQQRHAKFNDAFGQLEPDVKAGPGGLRDIQTISWVTNRHFGGADLRGLAEHGFLTEEEYHALIEGREFLWQIRCALHFAAGRRVDRLLFDHQRGVAAALGYTGEGNAPVEAFMRSYYRTVRELASLNDMLLGLFEEAILEDPDSARIKALNRRFNIRNDAIEARHAGVFRRRPQALLEIFLLMQQHPEIKGVRASTIRLIREHLDLIDERFRHDIRSRSLFLEILRQPRRIADVLMRMHRYGVLGAYLPAFARVAGLMQFDLFHIYTVDEHSMFLVRNLRRFSFPVRAEDCPGQCRAALERVPKLELLYVAGLFHDIAKGRQGDHSVLGAEEAVAFCAAHGFSNYDTHLVAWLVRNHLLMSATAQRKDIYDPAVIAEFAREIGDEVHLDYLYLLTVADIRATNPDLWTSWKASLLGELYGATRRLMHRRPDPAVEVTERVRALRVEAGELIRAHLLHLPPARLQRFWDELGDDYFVRHRADEIAWHAEIALGASTDELPVVATRAVPARGGTAVFVYARDGDALFALTTAALDRLQLDIQDARIMTTAGGYTLDTYMVLERESGAVVDGRARLDEIASRVRATLRGETPPVVPAPLGARRKLRHFHIPTEVNFSRDEHRRSVMEVIATDQPGLLSRIGSALEECGVTLIDARIATFGERVEDYFYIAARDGRPYTDAGAQERLRTCIIEALEQ